MANNALPHPTPGYALVESESSGQVGNLVYTPQKETHTIREAKVLAVGAPIKYLTYQGEYERTAPCKKGDTIHYKAGYTTEALKFKGKQILYIEFKDITAVL